MKKSKIIVFLFIALSVLIVGYVLYGSYWSVEAKRGKANVLNSRKVKPQMIQENVLTIMGEPDTIINERFCYRSNDDSYPYIEFSFDSLGRVKEIYSPYKAQAHN